MSATDAAASPLAGRTLLLSGGSRGIGLAIATAAARAGMNVAFLAKTVDPDPRIPGTIHTAAEEIERAGGRVLPIVGDVRSSDIVDDAVRRTVDRFGGIDVVVSNASAIHLGGIGEIDARRFGLILDVNVRGTFNLITAALPHLLVSESPRVLSLSPPLSSDRRWLAEHSPYTVTKYGMTMLTLGLAQQYAGRIAACCLWPETFIATAAVRNVVSGEAGIRASRRPEIMADAAVALLTARADRVSGRCHIDADVLRRSGSVDLSGYAVVPGTADGDLALDLFVDEARHR